MSASTSISAHRRRALSWFRRRVMTASGHRGIGDGMAGTMFGLKDDGFRHVKAIVGYPSAGMRETIITIASRPVVGSERAINTGMSDMIDMNGMNDVGMNIGTTTKVVGAK